MKLKDEVNELKDDNRRLEELLIEDKRLLNHLLQKKKGMK